MFVLVLKEGKLGKENKAISRQEKQKNKKVMPAVILILIIGLAGGYILSCSSGDSDISVNGHRHMSRGWKGNETKSLLSPSLFFGKVASTYKIAHEIPDVLDQLYCYCYCEKNFEHKSLLSCYTDSHASECDICLNEAIRASELRKKGHNIGEIQEKIDAEFYRPYKG